MTPYPWCELFKIIKWVGHVPTQLWCLYPPDLLAIFLLFSYVSYDHHSRHCHLHKNYGLIEAKAPLGFTLKAWKLWCCPAELQELAMYSWVVAVEVTYVPCYYTLWYMSWLLYSLIHKLAKVLLDILEFWLIPIGGDFTQNSHPCIKGDFGQVYCGW